MRSNKIKRKRRVWTEKEKTLLTMLYPNLQGKEIARKLNRPLSSIYGMAKILNLKKSEAFKNSPLSGGFQKGSRVGSKNWFKKGHLPANKGKKIADFVTDPDILMRIKANQFKPGQLPANTLKDGVITSRRDKTGRIYKWIRISKGHWEMLHVHLYKKHHGKVPKGKIIAFSDNNSMNLNIDNLIAITLKEHMERSRLRDGTVANYLSGRNKEMRNLVLKNRELLELKKTQLLLNKTIKNHEKTK